MGMKEVGNVKELWRFPFKSMAGESLESTPIDKTGIVGDRRWSVRDKRLDELITCKAFPSLLMCAAKYMEAPRPGFEATPVSITIPDGRTITTNDASADLALSAVVGRPVSLWPLQPATNTEHYRRRNPLTHETTMKYMGLVPGDPFPNFSESNPEMINEIQYFTTPRGIYKDASPISFITTASLRSLEREMPGLQLEARRFRANMVFDTGSNFKGFPEFDWKGFDLIIGNTVIHYGAKTVRCVMPMRPQYGGLKPEPRLSNLLKRVTDYFLGATGVIRETGDVKVGDSIYLDTRRKLHPVKQSFLPIPPEIVESISTAKVSTLKSFSAMRITTKEKEADNIISLGLKADPTFYQPYLPGQHITLRLQLKDRSSPLVRSYTISGPQCESYDYRITVKREEMGAASRYLHDEVQVGDEIEARMPAGNFFVIAEQTTPLVLISNGIGITPLFHILERISKANPARQVYWIHATENSDSHTFKSDITSCSTRMQNFSSFTVYRRPNETDRLGQDYDSTSYLDTESLRPVTTMPGANVFICGSHTFMDSVKSMLLDDLKIEEGALFIEQFANKHFIKGANEQSTAVRSVRFERSDIDAEWSEADGSLLDLAESFDLSVDSGCRFGNCKACSVRLLSGQADYPEVEVTTEPDEILLCCARPTSDISLDL